MRLIVDLLGNRHKDLFLKIEVFPVNKLIVSDSYYWADFLQIDQKKLDENSNENFVKIISIEIIKYWKEFFESLQKNETKYLIVDLSDEYISLFKITKTKFGIKMQKIISEEYSGFNITKDMILGNFEISKFQLDDEEFLISEQSINDGLNWSLNQIKNVV